MIFTTTDRLPIISSSMQFILKTSHILFLFFFTISFFSFSQVSVSMNELTGTNSKYYEGELFTGIAFSYYENGSIEEERHYVNGIREGSSKTYDKNGKLVAKSNHHNNEWHGLSTLFHDNGKVKSKLSFSDGIMQYHKDFDKNGTKRSFINYKNGEITFAEIFHSNGQKVWQIITSPLSMSCWDIYGNQITCDPETNESYIRELMDM